MQRVRAKICGITRPQDARVAVECGVDAIGMILYADSRRTITEKAALEIRKVVPSSVCLIGVFVNALQHRVLELYKLLSLDLIQLHGEEPPEYARQLNLPFIRAIRAKSSQQVLEDIDAYSGARAVLLDPYVKGQHGGTGQQLDTEFWPESAAKTTSLILAGGLSPSNIFESLESVNPFGVDLNSGLELSPGVKCEEKIRHIMSSIDVWNQQ